MQSGDGWAGTRNIYVMDTSSLIDAKLWYWEIRAFWLFLGDLINQGKILIPLAVKYEIDDGDDALKKFLNDYRDKIIDPNEDIKKFINDIDEQYDGYYSSSQKNMADAHVVATALYYKEYYAKHPRLDVRSVEIYVITEESSGSETRNGTPKIPDVCKKYEMRHKKIRNILSLENKILCDTTPP
jgi:hypothetical protein